MKSLEIFIGQEVQALQKAVVRRFETIEEIIRADEPGREGTRKGINIASTCQSQVSTL